ncbi:MAG: lipid-A-disaccharide synthase [Neisseriaceae bacterium]
MNSDSLKIAIVAGEASGDVLGAALMRSIRNHHPEVTFFGVGGPLMEAEGISNYFKADQLAVMGLVEILKSLPQLLKIRHRLLEYLLLLKPDVYIGIDAPDFNFWIEKKLHEQKIAVVHYVSPSVWAWRTGRVKKIVKFTDLVLCLFPEEAETYVKAGGKAIFVGHPLASEIPLNISLKKSRQKLALREETLLISLMPGSRQQEIKRLAPLFLSTAKQLYYSYPELQLAIPYSSQVNRQLIEKIIQEHHWQFLPIHWVGAKEKHFYLSASNVTLVASGTATLEAALCRCPMVIAYKLSSISYFLLKRLVHTSLFGLPNLLLKRQVVPELIQDAATEEGLLTATQAWLNNGQKLDEVSQLFSQLHQNLHKNTSELAAIAILELIKEHKT